MIEIFLLLLGARVVRRKWWIVALAGSVWLILGAYFLYDSFLDTRLSGTWFAIPMLIEAAVSAFGGVQTGGTERSLRFGKAILLVLIALVVVEAPWHEDMIVGILAVTYSSMYVASGVALDLGSSHRDLMPSERTAPVDDLP